MDELYIDGKKFTPFDFENDLTRLKPFLLRLVVNYADIDGIKIFREETDGSFKRRHIANLTDDTDYSIELGALLYKTPLGKIEKLTEEQFDYFIKNAKKNITYCNGNDYTSIRNEIRFCKIINYKPEN